MPHLTQQLAADGPVLDFIVGVSHAREAALRKAGQQIPKPIRIRGLIDTGASNTCVDPTVLQALNLTPTGSVSMQTPSTGGTPHLCGLYDVSLTLLHPQLSMTLRTIPVAETDLQGQAISALIGRDVLANCLLVYDGGAQTFSLAF